MSEADLLTRISSLEHELSIAKQQLRDVHADNMALQKRAALAVTQEADTLQPVFAAQMEARVCYRCGHAANQPDPGCRCCENAHTPDQDGNFA